MITAVLLAGSLELLQILFQCAGRMIASGCSGLFGSVSNKISFGHGK